MNVRMRRSHLHISACAVYGPHGPVPFVQCSVHDGFTGSPYPLCSARLNTIISVCLLWWTLFDWQWGWYWTPREFWVVSECKWNLNLRDLWNLILRWFLLLTCKVRFSNNSVLKWLKERAENYSLSNKKNLGHKLVVQYKPEEWPLWTDLFHPPTTKKSPRLATLFLVLTKLFPPGKRKKCNKRRKKNAVKLPLMLF